MNSYRVIFTHEAEKDLDNIFDYLLSESSNAIVAESFIKKLIYSVKEGLTFMPSKHPVYKNQVHALYSQNIPTTVHFLRLTKHINQYLFSQSPIANNLPDI
jgi:transposase-like protein